MTEAKLEEELLFDGRDGAPVPAEDIERSLGIMKRGEEAEGE